VWLCGLCLNTKNPKFSQLWFEEFYLVVCNTMQSTGRTTDFLGEHSLNLQGLRGRNQREVGSKASCFSEMVADFQRNNNFYIPENRTLPFINSIVLFSYGPREIVKDVSILTKTVNFCVLFIVIYF
jgi:hypothetical protein